MAIKLQTQAPNFDLPDQNGKAHQLSDYQNHWVLLYFYPKDDTPGCTKEACGLRDAWAEFKKNQAIVLGVSKDNISSHQKFAQKYHLPFAILADEKKLVLKKYGVWQKKSFLGKKFMGTARTSFLINPKGKIAKIYKNVKPDRHAKEVLADLKMLKIKSRPQKN
jgi:peroxiredoxin Q/BCP